MSEETKKEKAGAAAPAASSKVEGTQNNEALAAENNALKTELENVKAEFENFKNELKPKVEALVAENEKLKAAVSKNKKAKSGDPIYVVTSAFRGVKKGEGIFALGDDVSHFDNDRLSDLVEKGLVKEV